jgi:hypothetical protein
MIFFWILIQALCFLPLQLALEVSGSEQNSSLVDTLPLGRLDSDQLRELQSVLPCWIQVGNDINGEAANDWFGRSVAMSDDGTRVAIGASGNGSGSGHVRVLEYNASSGAWIQLGSDIDGDASDDRSGVSVAISEDGSRVAVGAPKNDSNGGDSGHVRIFDYNASSGAWIQVGSDIGGESAGDWFGFSVAMSEDGSRIAVGAWKNNGGNGNNSGHVRVFDYDTSSGDWIQVGSDIDGEASDDRSGYSVAMSEDGSRVAVGAFDNDENGNNSGHVRVFDYNTSSGAWIQVGSDINGEASDDYFGRSVAMSDDGTRVAIGAVLNDGNGNNSGHVRVFDYDTTTSSGDWIQVGSDINGEASDDKFGTSVAISDDGARIAVGAWSNDGSGGGDSGHVRVFDYNTSSGAWIQVGSDIDGEIAGDRSGGSVAMSDDGTTVAIGAINNDANGSDSGHVRVYTPSFDDCVNTPSAAPSTSPSAAPVVGPPPPTSMPTVTTPVPTATPTAQPTTGCSDTDGKFTVGTGNDKGCGWLKAKDVRKTRHCGTTEVQSVCPSTCCDCGTCPTSRPTPAPTTPAPVSVAPTAPSKGGKGGKGTTQVLRGGLNQH